MNNKYGIPANAKKLDRTRALALGEMSGHHHSLMSDNSAALDSQVEMYETPNGETYLRALEGSDVSLVHQEHKAHGIVAGESYRVTVQQEFDDSSWRNVAD